MSIYEIDWTEESFYRVKIEANTEQEAIDKWSARDFDGEDLFGGEIQDGVGIRLVEEA